MRICYYHDPLDRDGNGNFSFPLKYIQQAVENIRIIFDDHCNLMFRAVQSVKEICHPDIPRLSITRAHIPTIVIIEAVAYNRLILFKIYTRKSQIVKIVSTYLLIRVA